ncbi:MAG: hypothetical protein Q8S01_02100 [Ignavibacteria bacterium]|nr:hypothetical protein [Ignavibacteria bacterium]
MNQIKITIAITLLFASVVTAQQPFEYNVYMHKDTFLVGELVDIGVSIKNTSNNLQTSGTVDIKMFDESGRKLNGFATPGLFSPPSKILKPNDETSKFIILNVHFGVQHTTFSHDFFKKGTYTIKVYFSVLGENKPDLIEKIIKIVEPEDGEGVVYKSFIEIDERKGPYDPRKQVIDLEALYTAHPSSVYGSLILSKISRLYRIWLKDNSHEKEIAKKFMENYTWSSKTFFYYETDFYKEVIPNKDERIQYLKKRLPDVKNTPMQKQIERKLKEEMEK